MNRTQRDDAEQQQLRNLSAEWASAELRGDIAFLERTLVDDFTGVGPRGFTLTKEEWVQRHQSGALQYSALTMDDVHVRVYGEAAILIGRETQTASYQGQDIPGQFRTTQVWVRQDGCWLLAGLQLSPLMSPLAAPS
ncbi:MAG: nuclear transport factor 2 family protein [Ktedonobacterales bacterium]